jgi:hypothetical protein
MEVLRHEHIFMQQIGTSSIRMQDFQEEFCPTRIVEKRPTLPGSRGNKICLGIAGRVLACRFRKSSLLRG